MLPLEGRNLLLVTWLPSTELYKSVKPLVKEGEKNLYLFGREVHLVFCNDPSRFGAGIGYLTARGDQAFFSLYVCEQTEEMSETEAMASLDRASGAPKSTPRQVPPTLALYIRAQHVADSSNVACEMTRRRSARHEVGDRHRQNVDDGVSWRHKPHDGF